MDISSMIYFLCPKIIKTALSVSLSRFIITLGVLLPPVPRAPRLFRRQTVGTVDGIPVRGPAVGDLHWTRTPKTTLEARSQRTDSVRCS